MVLNMTVEYTVRFEFQMTDVICLYINRRSNKEQQLSAAAVDVVFVSLLDATDDGSLFAL